jgi:antitoxin VapB
VRKTAALFTNGGSQAVRLPADCRFDGDRVYVRRDARTGDVILSSRPPSAWREFMKLRAELGPIAEAENFLEDRPLNASDGLRDPFAESGQ